MVCKIGCAARSMMAHSSSTSPNQRLVSSKEAPSSSKRVAWRPFRYEPCQKPDVPPGLPAAFSFSDTRVCGPTKMLIEERPTVFLKLDYNGDGINGNEAGTRRALARSHSGRPFSFRAAPRWSIIWLVVGTAAPWLDNVRA